ncbi:hypothetical protein BDV96DRAFT_397458 [Lophiotrema nucula]|uniref:non-specific serine/threonine protein kinase n=1 Tax=Lophiotrema nucula TaxID=690887 RepID=A0A6A5ZED9_9PLEO|nr:hypothetical protein BDV96DRAFT_397458 [Lophiotrema nucula]
MGDPKADLTAGVEPNIEQPGRNSPASAVCYHGMEQAQEHRAPGHAPASAAVIEPGGGKRHEVELAGSEPSLRAGDDSDNTPRSEVPENFSAVPQLAHQVDGEPGYFSPRPLRLHASSRFPSSASNSTDPSPTASLNASTTSVHIVNPPSTGHAEKPRTPADNLDRPGVQRDHSNTSTTSVATIRAPSAEPVPSSTPPSRKRRDGPQYPNQSYAALQSQHHPPPYSPHILRTRSSHPSHYSTQSVSSITTSDLTYDIMDSGSRTVGNSPAHSPGLFDPTTPPLRHNNADESGYYPSPYLHHTHRVAPKETHVADIDVDPISGRKIINQYEVIDELGRGVHGKVKLGRNLETGLFIAIKIVDRYSKRRRLGKNTSHEDKIKKEIAILKKARHPHIVSLLEVIDDPSRKKVYIVLEHVELGEVKWRTEGTKEVTLIEWRRYQRESEGIFENESAKLEDERILHLAHQRLARQQRRRTREIHARRITSPTVENEPWSIEHGGDSDEGESYESWKTSRSRRSEDRLSHRYASETMLFHEPSMETAYRSTTPIASSRPDDDREATGLEGTMYGAYDTELIRGRTPSLAGSSSSYFTDEEEEVPEHFRHVPLMTIPAAREAFRDTVLGLEYLHYQNVIHRDIKPANLLQTKEHRIKISDFGVSYLGRRTTEDPSGDQSESDYQDADEAIELAKTVGTPAFYAPELCRTDLDGPTPQVTHKIDIWALGVTLYCLIFGRVPFHENNPFALMKLITDTEAYIPRFRLKPVAEQSGSRPNSHGRLYHNTTTSRRAPHDLEYEPVDDTLRDLLKRLLIKDQKQRISIKEIKHHPWLLQGIDNSTTWVEETDPSRSFQGRKIEVSKEDVEQAVVPITLIDRVRSGVRKAFDLVTGTTKPRGGSQSRKRAPSAVTAPDQLHPSSANSSSSTISQQEGRRPSLAMNQSIFEALSKSREPEHPLSQSVTASPEATDRLRYFERQDSRTGSPAHTLDSMEHIAALPGLSRPAAPERAQSTISSGASIRTVRQADLLRSGRPHSPSLPPANPGTPLALDTPGGSNLGGLFGGLPRKIVKNMRSRDRTLRLSHDRAQSIDRLVGTDDDPHSGPSIALSNAVATGHNDTPDILRELSPSLARGPSPHFPEAHHYETLERTPSRQSSVSSASSHLNRAYTNQSQLEVGPMYDFNRAALSPLLRETSEDRFNRAKDEFVRQRVREENQGRERPRALSFQRPVSAFSQTHCPPSPDDEMFNPTQKIEDYLEETHKDECPPGIDTSDLHFSKPQGLVSSSSEDQFTSMSQSTSNPSIPSVVSADSSVAAEDCLRTVTISTVAPIPSAESINQFDHPTDDPAGYDGDHALESAEEDEDSDEDFIMMGKKKPKAQDKRRSGSISNAELARSGIRKEIIPSRRRSTRSGSNGTVKKIRPYEHSDNDDQK